MTHFNTLSSFRGLLSLGAVLAFAAPGCGVVPDSLPVARPVAGSARHMS